MHHRAPSALRLFSISLFCQAVAGVEYWWPALLTSLQPNLRLSPTQFLFLTAVANAGGSLSIPAGFYHSFYGSRKTALLGTFSLTLCFLILALLPFTSNQLRFPIALVITALTVPAAYAVYAAGVCLCSAVFPQSFRGRVVGLLTAAYAVAAAMYSSMQSAFFSNPDQATTLLLTCAAISTFAGFLVLIFFPPVDHFDTESYYHDEENYQSIPRTLPADTLISNRIHVAYRLILTLVIILQLGTISEAFSAPSAFLKLSVLATLLVTVLLFTYVPQNSPLRVRATVASDTAQSESILSVIQDARFIYLAFARLLVISGGGLTLLIQSRNIVSSRLALTQPDAVPGAVRTIVLIFSTSNLTARLLVGLLMDAPTEEESDMRKYNIFHSASLILAVALPLIALAPYWGILLGVVVVGMCHGMYFSAAPALCTLWFGAREYPRNWSALGPFHIAGILTIATVIPALLMERFGNWVMVEEQRICVGVMCTFPTFAVIGVLDLVLYGVGWLLKKRLRK